jgi:subtilisin family serine protease
MAVLGCSRGGAPTVPAGERALGGPEDTSLTVGAVGVESDADAPVDTEKPSSQAREYVEDEVLVVLQESVTEPVTFEMLQGWLLAPRRVHHFRWGTLYVLGITDGTPVPDMVKRLKADPRVRVAEPNGFYYPMEEPYTPNDPMWEGDDPGDDPRDNVYDQWGPAKIGASIVWNETKGSSEVVIAIADTGCRYDHEDLHDHIWINEDEIPDNGEDDDENGWVDDWWGWDCYEGDNDPSDQPGFFSDFHGTSCAGVAAAIQDNERGVTGVAPRVKIMVARCLGTFGGTWESITEAIEYARVNGADIVSMSLGGGQYSEVLEIECNDAWDNGNGIVLMAAAGNEGSYGVSYPARYQSVMAVGAVAAFSESNEPTDEQRLTSALGYGWASNYGEDLVVMGFGSKYTTTYGSHYSAYRDGLSVDFFGGTSCATPMSAGVMALLRSYFPDKSAQWCWDRLKDTADDLDVPGFDIQTGHGRCNALRALYGSDRFEGEEDEDGFVTLKMPIAHVFDSIHDAEGSAFEDIEDLYRFVTVGSGELSIDLDIYTWGENLDMALYSDVDMTQLVEESTGENHADSSTESISLDVEAGEEYFLKVYSPVLGSSTTYGLEVVGPSPDMWIVGESLAPPSINVQAEIVPFLKLTVYVSYQATLDELIVNKSGSLPNANLAQVRLYRDSNGNGVFEESEDELVAQKAPMGLNRFRLDDLGLAWTSDEPLVLFVAVDVSETLDHRDLRLSLESYKDVITEEGIEAPYTDFPIASDTLTINP